MKLCVNTFKRIFCLKYSDIFGYFQRSRFIYNNNCIIICEQLKVSKIFERVLRLRYIGILYYKLYTRGSHVRSDNKENTCTKCPGWIKGPTCFISIMYWQQPNISRHYLQLIICFFVFCCCCFQYTYTGEFIVQKNITFIMTCKHIYT